MIRLVYNQSIEAMWKIQDLLQMLLHTMVPENKLEDDARPSYLKSRGTVHHQGIRLALGVVRTSLADKEPSDRRGIRHA